MNKEKSIEGQKKAGTYNRNELIKTLYRPGLGEVLGQRFGISRERIRQIRSSPSENHRPKKERWWKRLRFWR